MWLTETKLLSLYSSAAFATIMESLLTKRRKTSWTQKPFNLVKVVVRRHLVSVYDHQGNRWLVHLYDSKQFYSNSKKGQNGEKLRQLNPASKVSKRGVSAASVYAINEQKGLHSSRCLLTVVVNRLKGILERVIFWFVSLLLPVDQAKHQACWEGHNLKQHYLTRKHFSAIYNAKWQRATHGKPEQMASSFLQLLMLAGVCPYLLTVLHRGHSGQKMQCCRKWINSTKLQNCQFMHVNWFFYGLSNPNPHLKHILLSNTHWISLTPWWNTGHGLLQSLSSSWSF